MTEHDIFEEMEQVLDTYFPKGDPRRRDALILFATGMARVHKLLHPLPVIKA